MLMAFNLTGKSQVEGVANWTKKIEKCHLKNFYQIDSLVYRSEQPRHRSMIELKQMGIMKIMNLRNFKKDDWRSRGTNLKLEHIAINTWRMNKEELIRATKVLLQAHEPILVHCLHGSDRTGAVIACYRICKYNWPIEKAINEMVNGGYGFHKKTFQNIIQLLNEINWDEFKENVRAPIL